MTNLIIDLILIAILVLCIWRGVTKGLILSVAGLLAIVLSFYGARYIAGNYSEHFVDAMIPFVGSVVEEKTTDEFVERNVISGEADHDEIVDIAKSVLMNMGLTETAAETKARAAVEGVTHLGDELKEAISNSFMETLAYVFTFAIAFVLINIVFSVILNLANVMFKLPGLHLLNTLGGGVAGLIYGLLMVFVIAWIIRFLGFVIKPEIVERTIFLKWLVNANPLTRLMGF